MVGISGLLMTEATQAWVPVGKTLGFLMWFTNSLNSSKLTHTNKKCPRVLCATLGDLFVFRKFTGGQRATFIFTG